MEKRIRELNSRAHIAVYMQRGSLSNQPRCDKVPVPLWPSDCWRSRHHLSHRQCGQPAHRLGFLRPAAGRSLAHGMDVHRRPAIPCGEQCDFAATLDRPAGFAGHLHGLDGVVPLHTAASCGPKPVFPRAPLGWGRLFRFAKPAIRRHPVMRLSGREVEGHSPLNFPETLMQMQSGEKR